ncbi:cyclopropane-fatty-acyl-phospholipid synthase family protein [Paucibacter sp. R3-3]|uniref:Cyclopropane-fatty-acyl-phospholipid synthase family protein n=1 Tax=Roseateles agri TaxID=3098619 RepID=A0ABU5DJF7_9BURK|nr:cyclopropane-fatty-acyl-phospholipid synthase family protein [Paucibacter sp. R3-3]MDY0746436.1 cyclopropane-fatty-acyl-phospholipid synthase family protein [Paucibacter sp. R3-3]
MWFEWPEEMAHNAPRIASASLKRDDSCPSKEDKPMILDCLLKAWVHVGTLTVLYPDGTRRSYGTGGAPRAGLAIKTRRAEWRIATNPALALGESYMDGDAIPLDCTLHELLDLAFLNSAGKAHPVEQWLEKLRWIARRWQQFNGPVRSRRNVAHHYDLDGRVYSHLLDTDMQYSCAYYPHGDETLCEAQVAKKRHIAAKLHLNRPDLEVLDIGCGWGGMALHLAREHGARVVGLTLSTEQLEVARNRATREGLSDRVSFELLDYRAWTRPVDRIVSVGMFEHVGINQHGAFFDMVFSSLREHGVALIHAIGQNTVPTSTNPWISKYIFPGGYSPALSEVLRAVEESGLWTTDIEILRLHYAKTLAHWRDNFARHAATFRSLCDDRFVRMFEFYLSSSELSFRRLRLVNWQLQLARKVDTLPLSRDYMMENERRHHRYGSGAVIARA